MPVAQQTTESVREHSECSLELDRRAVNALRVPAFRKRLTITPDFEPARYTIRTGSFVGRVVVPGLSLQITPKVGIRQVLAMIRPDRLAAGIGDSVDRYATDELADAVAALYQRSVADALARGMRRRYVAHEERLIALRGRIDLTTQVRSPLPTPTACRFDEYTIDNQHNRLLKAGLRRALRLEGVTKQTRSSLLRTLQWFGEVSDRPPAVTPLLRQGFGRLDRHYEGPCKLAALILESSALGDAVGEQAAHTFLVDMNKVFEEFIEDELRQQLPNSVRLSAQYRTHIDFDGRVPIRPDLVFWSGDNPMFVVDVKYKQPEDDEGRESDLYQVIAYATAIGVEQAALIYATDVDRPIVQLSIAGGRTVHVIHLNVAGSRSSILRDLSRLTQLLAA